MQLKPMHKDWGSSIPGHSACLLTGLLISSTTFPVSDRDPNLGRCEPRQSVSISSWLLSSDVVHSHRYTRTCFASDWSPLQWQHLNLNSTSILKAAPSPPRRPAAPDKNSSAQIILHAATTGPINPVITALWPWPYMAERLVADAAQPSKAAAERLDSNPGRETN